MNAQTKYDCLVVGTGLYGAVFAHEMAAAGRKVLVVDRRSHIGGNCYTEAIAKPRLGEVLQLPRAKEGFCNSCPVG